MARQKKKNNKQILSLISYALAIVIIIGTGVGIGLHTSDIAYKYIFSPSAKEERDNKKPQKSESGKKSSSSAPQKSEPAEQLVQRGGYTLDANYTRLLLVNDKNPLPEDYNYGWNLAEIPQKYIKGSLTEVDAGALPFMLAMLDAAAADGVDLGVWSPYRSYNTQKWLFENQVKRAGGDEDLAATVVARPGTSEHNTGLGVDFNMASDKFETTAAYTWMKENAEDYGFIMRYSKEKQPKTGVIHESWHWRFVGINAAKEINKKGYCLEEYIEYLEKNTNFKRNTNLYENGISELSKKN